MTVLIAGVIQDVTGIPPERISDVLIVYTTVEEKIGVLTYACCPQHGAEMLAHGAAILAEDSPPDISIPCK